MCMVVENDNIGENSGMGPRESSVLPLQLFCKAKGILKESVFFFKIEKNSSQ